MPAMTQAKKLVAAGGIAGWFGFNAAMAFYIYLTRNSPDLPDFDARLVMPMHQHTRTFYVQVWEQRLVLIGLALSLLLVFSAIVLGYLFCREEFRAQRRIGWLNASAGAAFAALAVYSWWPL